jgi:cytochrome c553
MNKSLGIPSALAVRVVLAAVVSIPLPAVAQTPGDIVVASEPTSGFPAWAYPWDPEYKAPPADDALQRVPGSTETFSLAQARNLYFSPDWHPDDHPSMPEVVSRGREPDVRACGSCHRAEGTGGPENSSLAGLPAAYIVQQMADFRSGARRFSGPERAPTMLMIAGARAVTDAEVQAAAEYFSALKPKQNIKVIETDVVPGSYVAANFRVISEGGDEEPIGSRILETPEHVEHFELRDSRVQFLAYVPIGSVARGEALARTGGDGRTIACAACHGPDLKGLGPIPGIAGRSPSYIVRQLYDFRQGNRAGIGSALMKPSVERLSEEDMISLAAYLATLAP